MIFFVIVRWFGDDILWLEDLMLLKIIINNVLEKVNKWKKLGRNSLYLLIVIFFFGIGKIICIKNK